MRAWRWIRGTAAVLLLGATLTGCWDQHPVEFRAPVAVIAVDPTQTAGEYRFTFLFPNITITASSIESGGPSEQFFPITVRSKTLVEAVDEVQERQSRTLYLGQVRVMCLSSRLPASVWRDILEQSADSGRFVMTFWLVTSPDAQKTAEINPPTEVVPDVALYRALNSRVQPILWPGRGWRTWVDMSTPGVSPAVMEIHPAGRVFALDQLGVLSQKGIALWSLDASDGWAYATGRVHRETEVVVTDHEQTSVGSIRGHTSTRVEKTPHGVLVQLHVHCSGVVTSGFLGEGDSTGMDRQVEQSVAENIQEKILAAWHEALATHTDPMGFHRLGHWSNSHIDENPADWSGWTLETQVTFTLRDEGVLR